MLPGEWVSNNFLTRLLAIFSSHHSIFSHSPLLPHHLCLLWQAFTTCCVTKATPINLVDNCKLKSYRISLTVAFHVNCCSCPWGRATHTHIHMHTNFLDKSNLYNTYTPAPRHACTCFNNN